MAEARTFAQTRPTPAKRTGNCECGEKRAVEVILQARPKSRKGTYASRARSMCEACAVRVFEAMEKELDRD